jgi:hypothetical protein
MDPQQVVGWNQQNFSGGTIENTAVLEFQAGVSAVLRSWSALKTYVPSDVFWFGDTHF